MPAISTTDNLTTSASTSGLRVKLVAGVVLILLNVVGMAGFSLYRSHQQYDTRVAVQTQNLAQSLNLTLTGILQKSSVAVFSVKKEVERQARSGGVNRGAVQDYIKEHKARLLELDGLRVTDADGVIVYGDGVAADSRVQIGERDYFVQLRDNPKADMLLTRPLFGQISKKWVIEIVMRIEQPDGSFAGVAYAAISLDYLSKLFSTLDLGRHGVIDVHGRDLKVVARYPEPAGKSSIGSEDVDSELQAQVQAGRTKGTYQTKRGADRTERIVSFQKLSGYPLYIAAGLATDDYLAPWYDELRVTVLLTSALAALLLSSAWLLNRNRQRERRAESELNRYHLQLKETVRQRTSELELRNEQLAGEVLRRREAETELQKTAFVMQKMSDAVLWFSPEGRVLYANDTGCRMHGYGSGELASKTIYDLAPFFTPALWRTHWEELKREQTLHMEVLNMTASGQEFPLEVTANYLCIDGVEVNCAICREISERKEAEAEKQLLMQQLFQAQKIDSLGRLAGGIAHDFNNLLTPILGFAELLKREIPPDGQLYRRVDLIMQAADKAKVLVKQLLGFGRQQLLEMKTVDVNDVVRDFYEILRRTIRESIEINLSLCANPYGVRADANQLEQILMNLAVNAQDAIGDKGAIGIETAVVTLDAQYARQHAEVIPGEYLMLAVTDTGSGMDEETVSHIFEPFFTTKGIGQGTGLGLATIYGLVKQHQGHIWVYSEPGTGTAFKVFLPIVEGMPVQEAAKPRARPREQIRDCQLLLVEDSAVVRDMVFDLLESSGYNTLVADTPHKALRLAHENQIDLLLSDVVMPDMSGPELYRELQKINPDAKVLYMSGYTFNMIVHNGELDEGIHFLQKPFAVQDLTDTINAILVEA